ncbi:hypothetical protein [Dethiosulfovibrio salsuginis]|uniref:Uncharacterized protein n=1 Tax=Dethiosulfovibrio salsuginis TaxID=561720 RepID=A0A1X7JP73_9BACT|nr:hypothetical protein [Dethiosulfovibrio salsuginis]SMG30003.1 hypothetical protein SAMN06275492_11455 [Dethiosulfovibrio salsuginis]
MTLNEILAFATDKNNFKSIGNYACFCLHYLEFVKKGLQAVIVSRNEHHYRFFQYKDDGTYNVTRPINSLLMLPYETFDLERDAFLKLIRDIKAEDVRQEKNRALINNFIYTCQQSIGAALDGLPANRSNAARKINGDLFENLVRLVLSEIGVDASCGLSSLPVKINGEEAFRMNYQHDLILRSEGQIKAIGSVKTSSKDRLDKIFIDKFLYNRLTDSSTPHFAVFLNDVQRSGREGRYGVSATFLKGHFKGYTVKLNPLDGVYYFDIRPNMVSEDILKDHIKTFDRLIIDDIWRFI